MELREFPETTDSAARAGISSIVGLEEYMNNEMSIPSIDRRRSITPPLWMMEQAGKCGFAQEQTLARLSGNDQLAIRAPPRWSKSVPL